MLLRTPHARRAVPKGKRIVYASIFRAHPITVHQLDLFGILIAIMGAITVVLSASPSDVRLDPQALLAAIQQHDFIVYSIVYAVGIVILSFLSEGSIGTRWVYVDVGLCALFGMCTPYIAY